MMVDEIEYEKNSRGIRVKKCCASCRMKAIDVNLIRPSDKKSELRRFCVEHGKVVYNNDVCSLWQMGDDAKSFKSDYDGKVKTKAYLDFYREKVLKYRDDIEKAHIAKNVILEEKLKDELAEYKLNSRSEYVGELYEL